MRELPGESVYIFGKRPAGCAVVGRASRGGEDDLACGLLSLAGCSFVGRSSRGSGEEAFSPRDCPAESSAEAAAIAASNNCKEGAPHLLLPVKGLILAGVLSPRLGGFAPAAPAGKSAMSVCVARASGLLEGRCLLNLLQGGLQKSRKHDSYVPDRRVRQPSLRPRV